MNAHDPVAKTFTSDNGGTVNNLNIWYTGYEARTVSLNKLIKTISLSKLLLIAKNTRMQPRNIHSAVQSRG